MSNRKSLPPSVGSYRAVRRSELTEAQRRVLRLAGRERVLERIVAMLGDGRLSASQVQRRYGALMTEVGRA